MFTSVFAESADFPSGLLILFVLVAFLLGLIWPKDEGDSP